MRRTIVLLTTMALTLLVASGVVLAAGIGSAGAQGSVVGPGESIQKAIDAAHPGDTIIVRGVHREDVIIRKDGIKLLGQDAVIEAPDRADSKCSRVIGPEAICVLGDFDWNTGKVNRHVSDVSVSGFTIRGFKRKANEGFEVGMIEVMGARNATVVGNDIVGNAGVGIDAFGSINATIGRNNITGSKGGGILVNNTRNFNIVNNVVRNIPEGNQSAIVVEGAIATTVADNDLIGNPLGVLLIESTGTKILSNDITDSTLVGTVIFDSTGTKILSNDISRSGDSGISIFGPDRANNDAKVVGNNISGGAWGMYVGDVTKRGSGGPAGIYVADAHRGFFAGNTIHDNCAGMFFEADGFKAPVSGFEVKGNTVENNTRSCRPAGFERNVSGVGIALLGTTDMEVTGNHLSGNVPSGPTRISGGVVVSTDPFFGGSAKLRNNSVIGNHFGRNKPDIFWDESGSGNRFIGNLCNSSVPSRLCN
jgi:parallel beta-helix repeat protein